MKLPLALECTLKQVIDGSKFIGEIVNVSADESILGDDGEIDLGRFTPITFGSVHQGYYALGERIGNAFRDGGGIEVIICTQKQMYCKTSHIRQLFKRRTNQ